MASKVALTVPLGWTDCNADLLLDGLNVSPEPVEPQTPAQWRSAVTRKCAEILGERVHYLPAKVSSGASGPEAGFIPNDMWIVDKSYVSHLFVSQEWQNTIESVTKQFF